jgi:lactate dehydrogenase-like 2-hydroxyacid dehydrogenase
VYDGFYDGPEAAPLLQEFGEDRLLITGHIASLTSDARDGMSKMAVRSILNVMTNGADEHFIP